MALHPISDNMDSLTQAEKVVAVLIDNQLISGLDAINVLKEIWENNKKEEPIKTLLPDVPVCAVDGDDSARIYSAEKPQGRYHGCADYQLRRIHPNAGSLHDMAAASAESDLLCQSPVRMAVALAACHLYHAQLWL